MGGGIWRENAMLRNKWFIFCVIALQSVALGLSAQGSAFRAAAEQSVILAATGEQCNVGAVDVGNGPAPMPHDHAQCCILCMSQQSAEVLASTAIVIARAVFSWPRAVSATVCYFREDAGGIPLGWTASWSSRAPPSFS
ncbi:MAG: hypothetical protein C3F11_09085 [Methylocystaceae bacterium]|nr:MAG: hypothetical protein C3F11_09085 [Methylocystaceae bacterium]